MRRWIDAGYDKTLRLDYDLDQDAVVFDLGGYEGQWASDIYARYRCTVHVFEPVREYAQRIGARFERNPEIVPHPFGLASDTSACPLYRNGKGSTVFAAERGWRLPESQREQIELVRAEDFFVANGIARVELMKINIEGGEFDLLPHLIQTGRVRAIRNLQIQFHEFVPGALRRVEEIQRELERTHRLTYQEPFVWENWELIDAERPNAERPDRP